MRTHVLVSSNVNKASGPVISSLLVASIFFSGNSVSTINISNAQMDQPIKFNSDQALIHKSFSKIIGIPVDVAGYNSSKIDSGTDGLFMDKEKMENLKKLDAIASFGDNWNGNGAPPLNRNLINNARSIITSLNIQPEVFPTACDSLQMEYDKEDGAYLEIELKEEAAEVFSIDSSGNEKYTVILANIDEISKVVSDFYG